MLGAPWIRDENPDVKNLPFMIITARESRSSKSPRNTWLSNAGGAGHPHIMWPMEKYIRTSRMGTDRSRRFLSFGVSRSFRASSSAHEGPEPVFPDSAFPLTDAPYPASSTARMMSAGAAFPSTPMEFVRRLTEHDVTPGTLDTAFSTLFWHAAQLMPVT